MSGLIFHLIAHTHWDREWYLPHAAFHARLVAVLDDLLERLRADAEYRSFLLDGQTVLIEDYLRARPDREAAVRALVAAGRLQVGPWYVLADEQIPSGESLIRNLLLGAADAERLGDRSDVLYSPDAFGHPAAWPALAREFGLRFGVVWRGLGGAPGQERDLYRWHAPDGRDVLVWHLPPEGYEIGVGLANAGDGLAAAWTRVRDVLVRRAAGRHIPVFIGADHHAAPQDLAGLRDRLAVLEPAQGVRVSRLDEFFEQVAADAGPIATLRGEQRSSSRYAWTLQGVHGTRAPLKRRSSALEVVLERVAEPLAALASRTSPADPLSSTRRGGTSGRATGGERDRRAVLDVAWRTLVQCQFHDAIAGCCADSVARALESRLDDVEAYAAEIARGALHDLVGHDPDAAREPGVEHHPALVLWNPAARARGGVAIADLTWFRRDVIVGPPPPVGPPARDAAAPGRFALAGPDGAPIPVQVLHARAGHERLDAARHYPDQDEVHVVRVAFRAPSAPGLGVVSLTPISDSGPVRARGDATTAGVRTLANRFVRVTLEPTGALTLTDRRTGERFPDLLRLESEGDAGDTYTFCPTRAGGVVRGAGPVRRRLLARGPLVAAIEAIYELPGGDDVEKQRRTNDVTRKRRGWIGVRVVVMLHADSPVVRCVLDIDNQAANYRLRARFPTGVAGVAALAGTQLGVVTRPAMVVDAADYPLETPVPTAPAQRFVAVAAGRRGLALLAPGFFEYELTPDGDLLFTVLRAVGQLSRGDLPTRPGHAGWPTATPLAQCPGRDRVELAIVPLDDAAARRTDMLMQRWEDVFLPLRGAWLRDAVSVMPAPAGIALEGTGLVMSAVKPARAGAGAGMILRCYNATGERTTGMWRFTEGARTAHRVRADERESTSLPLEDRGRTLRFEAGPGEIVTILIT